MKKKGLVILFLLSLIYLAGCGQKESSWDRIKKEGALTVATPGTLYPTSYYDDSGTLVGFEIDMMTEIGKRLGLEINYIEIGVAEAFTSIDSGKVDLSVNNFDITSERLEKYDFSIPYKYSIGGMIVREDDSSGIDAKDLSDWEGKKAGGGAGTQYMKIAEKQGAETVIYDNVTSDVYLRDVSTGRTDFIPNDYFTQVIAVAYVTAQYPDIKVKMSDVQYNPTEQGIVMRKDSNKLKEEIDKVLAEMQEDGTLKAISEKYYAGQDLTKPIANIEDVPVVDVSTEE